MAAKFRRIAALAVTSVGTWAVVPVEPVRAVTIPSSVTTAAAPPPAAQGLPRSGA
jgi:hypothetical protein